MSIKHLRWNITSKMRPSNDRKEKVISFAKKIHKKLVDIKVQK